VIHSARLPGLSLELQSDHILELYCFVWGDEPCHAFLVQIARTESVGALRKAIKKEKRAFQSIDADSLILWNVSIPVNDDFKEIVKKVELKDEEALSPVNRLSTIFPVQQKDGHLHIIVHPSSVGGGEYLPFGE
jgi:hypothetical protein